MLVYCADLAHTHTVSDASLTIPLNIGYIKAYAAKALGETVEIRLFKHPSKLLAAVTERTPAIVGLSNYGWSEHLNQQIGRHLRRRLPEALIVVGGPNLDAEPNQRRTFLRRHAYADYAIVDGGEQPFSELVAWWRDDRADRNKLPANLLWLEGDDVRRTAERPLAKEIEDVPSPYLGGYLDEFIAAGMVPLFETNRGCPFRCTFCAWGMASKDLVRRFDLDTAIAEIEYVGARSRARNWIVCDANFGILKRDVDIARAIRAVKDKYGAPDRCHVWLAKNVTERNLEIGAILGDMVVPVMAVQSLDDQVLEYIKRDNISLDTYREYQKKFHAIGSTTYSDVIVPLPAETLATHLAGLRQLFDAGVDVIQNHNMRMLAGAETNSEETRRRFGFRTRYRLIHGDVGVYPTGNGEEIRSFEVEESLRATTTMTEDELFYLRRLHFLVDFCWNIDVYKPLLRLAQQHGTNPLRVLERMLEADAEREPAIVAFWSEFDAASRGEWFDSEEAIRAYFAAPANFRRLIDQDYEKLNIRFSVRILERYKPAFDRDFRRAIATTTQIPEPELDRVAEVTFAGFPELNENRDEVIVGSANAKPTRLVPARRRALVKDIVRRQPGRSVSKILNTQGFKLRDLCYVVDASFAHDRALRRSV